MKKYFLLTAFALLSLFAFSTESNAQAMGSEYGTGVGVKVGYWGGGALDIKHFLNSQNALEGLLSFGSHWMVINALYEYHHDIVDVRGLKWYVGPGAHLGFWSSNNEHSGAFFGVDGVIGLDYKFNNAPIDLSIDLQPSLSIPNGGFDLWGGLGIRFTF